MLIVDVKVNLNLIDKICIHNVTKNMSNKIHDYQVLEYPSGKKLIDKTIKHRRADGYRPLLMKVLKELIDSDVGYVLEEKF